MMYNDQKRDNTVGGISTTGHGEAIAKVCLAHRVISLVSQGRLGHDALDDSLSYMANRVGGPGGAVFLDKYGYFSQYFTTGTLINHDPKFISIFHSTKSTINMKEIFV